MFALFTVTRSVGVFAGSAVAVVRARVTQPMLSTVIAGSTEDAYLSSLPGDLVDGHPMAGAVPALHLPRLAQ